MVINSLSFDIKTFISMYLGFTLLTIVHSLELWISATNSATYHFLGKVTIKPKSYLTIFTSSSTSRICQTKHLEKALKRYKIDITAVDQIQRKRSDTNMNSTCTITVEFHNISIFFSIIYDSTEEALIQKL